MSKYKTLEELGYIQHPYSKNEIEFADENGYHIRFDLKAKEYIVFFYSIDGQFKRLANVVSFELHKAIELKMIALGVKDDV